MRVVFGGNCDCGNEETCGVMVLCDCGRSICYDCARYDEAGNMLCPACGCVQDFEKYSQELEEQWCKLDGEGEKQSQ